MKKIILYIVFGLAVCIPAFTQSPFAALDRAKEIKLLKSNREDVRRILADYNLDNFYNSEGSLVSEHYQWFHKNNAYIQISYSSGMCQETSGEWDVPEWTVIGIEVSPETSIPIKNIGIDYSKFRKERLYVNLPHSYVYHKKDLGIAFEVDKNEIRKIYLTPSKENYSLLCNDETVRKHYLSKSWFIDSKLKQRYMDFNLFADVVDLILGTTEINETCPASDSTKTESCPDSVNTISIQTIAKDPENDVLTYDYTVSGGKIIGQGDKVIWDLSGIKAGTYTITAGADDSCGVCGKTITKTVVVKECPNCHIK